MISPVQKRGKGPAWWLRKKVPLALRKVVGRAEVWRSLETTERREANTRCAVMSANLEIEWARLATKGAGSNPYPGLELPHSAPSHRDLLSGLSQAPRQDRGHQSIGVAECHLTEHADLRLLQRQSRKLSRGRSGDEVRPGWRVNGLHRFAEPCETPAHPCSRIDAF